ncbi:hypothetical protein [uncultured Jannaschia sp.]|uniref:hypothetical protein n=1 Tax=uncultured Jannaschia sp. TaxID=293347 RepID=UPI00262C3FEF|nr:hypothetical protein [uncultured Jannaschia sp.]
MFTSIADFLLGAALSRRPRIGHGTMRTPSRPRGEFARHDDLGWMARVGTW